MEFFPLQHKKKPDYSSNRSRNNRRNIAQFENDNSKKDDFGQASFKKATIPISGLPEVSQLKPLDKEKLMADFGLNADGNSKTKQPIQKKENNESVNEVNQEENSATSTFSQTNNRLITNQPQTTQFRKISDEEFKEAFDLNTNINQNIEPQPIQKKENNTGLPNNIKSNAENLSGLSMDDVKVHYNCPKPENIGVRAYTTGTDIYMDPGQEKHLGHEAWQVVQKKQGRVKPTV